MAQSEPATIDAEHLMAMRQFLGLEDIALEDGAKLLGAMTARTFPSGAQLAKRGAPLGLAWFVLEGELTVDERRLGPRQIAGMLEMFAELPGGASVTCATEVVALELRKADFLALLADDFEAVVSMLRLLAGAILRLAPYEHAPRRAPPRPIGHAYDFVERMTLLHELSTFAGAGAATLAEVAQELEERVLDGGLVAPSGAAMEEIFIVLEGSLRYGDVEIAPGDSIGALQALAEQPLDDVLFAAPGTRVLVGSMLTVIDLFEDDQPLAVSTLRALAQRALELGV